MQIDLIYYCFNSSEGSINTPVSQKWEFSGNYFMVQALFITLSFQEKSAIIWWWWWLVLYADHKEWEEEEAEKQYTCCPIRFVADLSLFSFLFCHVSHHSFIHLVMSYAHMLFYVEHLPLQVQKRSHLATRNR